MTKISKEEILHRLRTELTIGDGATGTMLDAFGCDPGAHESWNLDHPDQVRQVAAAYVDAGADLVETNTLCANRIALTRHGLADKVREICAAAVRLAREGVKGQALVAGSVGALGALLEPLGTLTVEEAQEAFRETTAALAEAGADLLFIETFTALDEARIAVEAAAATGLPIVACLSYGPGGKTIMGVSPAAAAESLAAAGADVVGANCGTLTFEQMEGVLAAYRAATDLPLAIVSNAGTPELIGGRTVFSATPAAFAEHMVRCANQGAQLVGGCCGTTPDHIRALAQRLGRA
jgi:methionine synthase I (cobalamin-dependent)